VCDEWPDLLHEDEKGGRPKRSAMNLAGRPQVVSHQHQQEDVGNQRRPARDSMDHRPTGNRSDRQPNGSNEDEALVRCRIGAGAEAKKISVAKITMSVRGTI